MATPLPLFLLEMQAATVLVKPLAERITRKAGDQVVAHAQRIVAVKTGSLKRSIKRGKAFSGGGDIRVVVSAGGPSSPHDVDYARYVEEGTSRMSPQPFMRPAVKKVVPQWERELADVMELLAAGRAGRAAGSIRRG